MAVKERTPLQKPVSSQNAISEDHSMKITVNERIHLSEFQPSDKAVCVEHLKEKEIYDRTLRIPYPYTEKDFQEWLKIVEKTTQQQGRPVHWVIRNEEALLIGGCGFDSLQIGKSHRAEIGYWLAKPYWGQGIMTDVVRSLCELGFSELG
jgi:RimJ/RimL family protein N-acetyltransferase